MHVQSNLDKVNNLLDNYNVNSDESVDLNEEFKDEDTKLLALLPLIADKMNSLYAIYYFSSIASMGEIVERVGLSENFQKFLSKPAWA